MPRASAATAEGLARESVAFIQEKFGFLLPYTPESLLLVDAIVDKIKATQATEEQAASILLRLGCYAGEVFVRHARGSWRPTAEMGSGPALSAFPLVVALPGLIGCDVIGEVHRRFREGGEASLAALYEGQQARARERATG